ncbi:MAG: hypothetical protein US69_C0002G0059 [candidate division TM6 bacterium GW2011_GWF2_38_10]|nr:MAG: hypothetical protein US69_C0002G0059 [candidate division TM6 bacterium GW2011_GWF2_38_10]
MKIIRKNIGVGLIRALTTGIFIAGLCCLWCVIPSSTVEAKSKKHKKKHETELSFSVLQDLGLQVPAYDDSIVRQTEHVLGKFEAQVKEQLDKLNDQAQRSIESIQAEMEQKAHEIRKESKVEADFVLQEAEENAQALLQEAQERAHEVAQEVYERAQQLKRDAALQAVDLINQAEERAIKERQEKRKRSLLKKIEAIQTDQGVIHYHEPIDTTPLERWRKEMAHAFKNDNTFMQDIIVAGEEPMHVDDFIKRFQDQEHWFDKTLRGTQVEHDESYKKIVKKQSLLHSVVGAQRKADLVLLDVVRKLSLDEQSRKKIRLLILYELNAAIQKALVEPAAAHHSLVRMDDGYDHIILHDGFIRNIVLNIAHEATGRILAAYPDFVSQVPVSKPSESVEASASVAAAPEKPLQPQAVAAVAAEDKKNQEIVAQYDDLVKATKSLKKEVKSQLRDKSQQELEAKLMVRELTATLEHQKKSAEIDKQVAIAHVRDHYIPQLEAKDKEALDLKLQVTSANQHVDRLDEEVKQAEKKLGMMHGDLQAAQKEAARAKELVERFEKDLRHERSAKVVAEQRAGLVEDLSSQAISEYARLVHERIAAMHAKVDHIELSYKDKEAVLKNMERDMRAKESELQLKQRAIEDQKTLVEQLRNAVSLNQKELDEIRHDVRGLLQTQKDFVRRERESLNKESVVVDLKKLTNEYQEHEQRSIAHNVEKLTAAEQENQNRRKLEHELSCLIDLQDSLLAMDK